MDFYAPLNVDNFNIEFIGYVRLLLAQHVSLLLICENSPSYKLYEKASSPAFLLAGTCTSDSPFK